MLTPKLALLILLVLSPVTALAASQQILWHVVTPGTVNAVAISTDGASVAAGVQINKTAGDVYLIDKSGSVRWSHSTDIAISSVAISGNGSFVAAGGWQLIGGSQSNLNCAYGCPAEFYTNGGVYFFDRDGDIVWKHSTGSDPVFQVLINGSRVLITTASRTLTTFDMGGRILSYYVNNQTGLIIPDGRNRIVGIGESGVNGTLFLLGPDNTQLWKRHMSSPALTIGVSAEGNTISAGTNWGLVSFGIRGNLLWNYTGDTPSSIAVSRNGSQTFAGFESDWRPSLIVFSSNGSILQSYHLGIVHQVALSDDGYLAVGSGPLDTGPFSGTSGGVYLLGPTGSFVAQGQTGLLVPTIILASTVMIALVALWKRKVLH